MLTKFTSATLSSVLLHLSTVYLSVCLRVCSSVPLSQEPVIQHRQLPAKLPERSRNGKCQADTGNASSIAAAQC